MSGSEEATKNIKQFLENKANSSPQFRALYESKGKPVEDCMSYIINSVQSRNEKQNKFICTNREVFALAVKFYEDPDAKAGKKSDCTVIGDCQFPLTDKQKEEALTKAMKRCEDEHYAKMQNKPKSKETTAKNQGHLFETPK